MSFANLKRNRNTIADLVASANPEKKADKSSYVDERQWKPTVDKAGNGYAVIRFLPARTVTWNLSVTGITGSKAQLVNGTSRSL